MNSVLPKKIIKKPPTKDYIINSYNCPSPAIEKHILGALVKCREHFYKDPLLQQKKLSPNIKEKETNYEAAYIVNQIMSSPNCPKELQDLNCTAFYLTKGGGYQFWGNCKYYVSVSFGDDTILIILN